MSEPCLFSTSRLYFRKLTSDDLYYYYKWMGDREVTQYLENRFLPHSVGDLQVYINQKNGDPNCLFLGILSSSLKTHIGNIKLDYIDWIHRRGEIGIMIGRKDFWGKGYGEEAIRGLCEFAFNELNLFRITAGCYEANKASLGAFQKAGFFVEGVYRKHIWCNGEWNDEVLMGLLKYEYQPRSLRVLPQSFSEDLLAEEASLD